MVRKVFRAGNSLVVSLPRESIDLLGIHEGSELNVEVDLEKRRILLSPAGPLEADVDAEFARQLEQFIARYRPALEALAR